MMQEKLSSRLQVSDQSGPDDKFLDFRLENEPWYVSTRASQKDRFKKALALIRKNCGNPGMVYDIGCADGQFSALLAVVGDNVVGWDCNSGRVAGNIERFRHLKNLHFYPRDILRDSLPEESADLVTALEILYYFSREEQTAFLLRVRQLLKDGGHFLMSVNVFSGSRFTEASVRKLLTRHFKIVAVTPIYRNAYYRFELKIIRLIDELNYLEKLRIFTPNILKLNRKFYPEKWNGILLRPSWVMDHVVIPVARRGALCLIGSRVLYAAVTYLTKLFSPARGKSQILFLARKEGGAFAGD